LRALLIYRNQPLKPTLTFDTIDRQRDRTKKIYRTLKEPLGTTKHSSEQSKDFTGYLKGRCTIICIKNKLDKMGHLHLLLDEMGLDEMGINPLHTFLPSTPPPLSPPSAHPPHSPHSSCSESYSQLYAYQYKPSQGEMVKQSSGWALYDSQSEYERMGLPNEHWKHTSINTSYEVPIVTDVCIQHTTLKTWYM